MEINVGDEVAYSASFLKSIGEFTGDMPAGRGTVISLQTVGQMKLARIKWDRGLPERVNVKNLSKVGGVGFASN